MENEKPRVYLDTSIFSYLVDSRDILEVDIERTHEWWEQEKQFYEVVTSQFAVSELEKKNFPNQDLALKYARGVKELDISQEIRQTAKYYIQEFVMPSDSERDAAHLAVASFYKVDYLLTWNCKHLANIKKKRHIEIINKKLGLFVPELITPNMLILGESQ